MLSADRKLKKAKLDVMRSTLPGLRLWAGVMSIGETRLCDKTPTAYTNGRDEVYGTAFVERLPLKQVSFVCLHEAVHKGLRHLTVWRKLFDKNPKLANMACDYVVNATIKAADPDETVVQMVRNPDGRLAVLYDPRFDGMSAKQIFDILEKEQKGGGQGQPDQGDPGGNGQPDESLDEHGWGDLDELDAEEEEALVKEIDMALRRGEIEAKRCGGGKGDMPAELGELLRPQINWRQALQEFITQNCQTKDDSTYRRLNRRFHAFDLIMPTTYGENLGRIAVGADLSGSMWSGDPSDMQKILSEFVGIVRMVNPDGVDLLYWDSHVTGHEEYSRGDYEMITQSMKPRGGGGTDPGCVPPYLKEKGIKPDCIIMLTDGHVFNNWGKDWPAPVLWVICGNRNITAGTGKTIHMD